MSRKSHHKPKAAESPKSITPAPKPAQEQISEHKSEDEIKSTINNAKKIRAGYKPESPIAAASLVAGISVAIIYALQLIAMREALDVTRQTMRIDQRPWMRMTADFSPIQVGNPVVANFHLINYGKIPAQSVVSVVVVEKINNGEQTMLAYPKPNLRMSTGIIFPNEKTDFFSSPAAYKERDQLVTRPLTPEEFSDYRDKKAFFVAYANVTYTDFFQVEHWTHFCIFMTPETVGAVSAFQCTQYNGIDNN